MHTKKPLFPQYPHMLHGGDYNPDQWKATPEIWDEDMRLAKLSGCNCFSVGIFLGRFAQVYGKKTCAAV